MDTPIVDCKEFFTEKKLALLGRGGLGPAVLVRVIGYFLTYRVIDCALLSIRPPSTFYISY